MVFHDFDCCFGCVNSVIVWLDQLDFDVLGSYVSIYRLGAFVVEDVEFWCQFLCLEVAVNVFECCDHARITAAFHWADDYCVDSVDVSNKNVVISTE